MRQFAQIQAISWIGASTIYSWATEGISNSILSAIIIVGGILWFILYYLIKIEERLNV